MAAKPIERFVKKQIAEQGGWDRILERLASGETQVAICREFLNPKTQQHISPGFFNRLLRADPKRRALAEAAMREGASVMVDIGLEKVNDVPPDKDAIQKARVQLDGYLRVAALRDRERFGESRQQVNVQVNVEGLHLNALRHPAELLTSGLGSLEDSAQLNAGARVGSEQSVSEQVA